MTRLVAVCGRRRLRARRGGRATGPDLAPAEEHGGDRAAAVVHGASSASAPARGHDAHRTDLADDPDGMSEFGRSSSGVPPCSAHHVTSFSRSCSSTGLVNFSTNFRNGHGKSLHVGSEGSAARMRRWQPSCCTIPTSQPGRARSRRRPDARAVCARRVPSGGKKATADSATQTTEGRGRGQDHRR